jgi:DNA invertase Pin-like site-specific DNA recombinase
MRPFGSGRPGCDRVKVALYIRVSTARQDAQNQLTQLRAMCRARAWDIYPKVYRDVEKGGDPKRIALNQLMHDARVGKFQGIVFWAWDRITRSGAGPAFKIMDDWRSWGVKWESLEEPYLSSASDPHTAELLLSILAWVAKQESIRISERTKAGMAQRRALGYRFGRGFKKGLPPK